MSIVWDCFIEEEKMIFNSDYVDLKNHLTKDLIAPAFKIIEKSYTNKYFLIIIFNDGSFLIIPLIIEKDLEEKELFILCNKIFKTKYKYLEKNNKSIEDIYKGFLLKRGAES